MLFDSIRAGSLTLADSDKLEKRAAIGLTQFSERIVVDLWKIRHHERIRRVVWVRHNLGLTTVGATCLKVQVSVGYMRGWAGCPARRAVAPTKR